MTWNRRRRSLKEYWIHSNLIIYPQGEVTEKLMTEKETFFLETEETSDTSPASEETSNTVEMEKKKETEKEKVKKAIVNLSLREEEDLVAMLTQKLKVHLI
jgi:hypothetical protein